jgi:N-acetylglutamate synthase-like GNAT family acetyltransferase
VTRSYQKAKSDCLYTHYQSNNLGEEMKALHQNVLTDQWQVQIATAYHVVYVSLIAEMITEANQEPGVALVLRTQEYIAAAMKQGHAAIALNGLGDVVGFCLIKLWDNGKFISNSGLVVKKEYREHGVGTAIIQKLYQLCVQQYPASTLFSLTDSPMVIKTRTAMGFGEVPYSDITQDPQFWQGCTTCPHYPTLVQNGGKKCLCKVLIKKITND